MVKYTLACRVAFSLLYNCFYCIMHQTYKLSKLIVNMFLYFRLTGTNIFNSTLNHGKFLFFCSLKMTLFVLALAPKDHVFHCTFCDNIAYAWYMPITIILYSANTR